jgi:hypothetical protein
MAERWAYCDRCSRWFYAQREVLDSSELRCPVCDASPSTVRDGEPEPTQSA